MAARFEAMAPPDHGDVILRAPLLSPSTTIVVALRIGEVFPCASSGRLLTDGNGWSKRRVGLRDESRVYVCIGASSAALGDQKARRA